MRRLRPFGLVMGAALLTSCGGDDGGDETAGAQSPSAGGANQAPSVHGTPPASVMQGTQFLFVPTANDADGDALTFSIQNKPNWATFTPSTGELRGTPGSADVGDYADIRISVSDGTTTVALPSFSVAVVSTATGAAVLSWNPPTQRSDGSALTNLAGYKIYWGTSQGSYFNSVTISNPGVTSYVVEQLTPATWYFVATAYDANGVESQFSNVASKTVL